MTSPIRCVAKLSQPEHYMALKSGGYTAVAASQAIDPFPNLAS